MRTTVTLDPDVLAQLQEFMSERRMSFKAAINDAIRSGLKMRQLQTRRFRQKTFDMGEAKVPLRKALQLAGEMEDEGIQRKMELRK